MGKRKKGGLFKKLGGMAKGLLGPALNLVAPGVGSMVGGVLNKPKKPKRPKGQFDTVGPEGMVGEPVIDGSGVKPCGVFCKIGGFFRRLFGGK